MRNSQSGYDSLFIEGCVQNRGHYERMMIQLKLRFFSVILCLIFVFDFPTNYMFIFYHVKSWLIITVKKAQRMYTGFYPVRILYKKVYKIQLLQHSLGSLHFYFFTDILPLGNKNAHSFMLP